MNIATNPTISATPHQRGSTLAHMVAMPNSSKPMLRSKTPGV